MLVLLIVITFILPATAIKYASGSTENSDETSNGPTDNSGSSSGGSTTDNSGSSSGGSTTDNNAAHHLEGLPLIIVPLDRLMVIYGE